MPRTDSLDYEYASQDFKKTAHGGESAKAIEVRLNTRSQWSCGIFLACEDLKEGSTIHSKPALFLFISFFSFFSFFF